MPPTTPLRPAACLVLLLSLVLGGCGSSPEIRPGQTRPSRVDRASRPEARGPDFDATWHVRAPEAGFLYAAFRGEASFQRLLGVLPESGARSSLAPGLAGWIQRLRSAAPAPDATLFPGGAALVLAGSGRGNAEDEPLDFWLLTPENPSLVQALGALREESAGKDPSPLSSRLLPGEGGGRPLMVLASREDWLAPGPGSAWVAEARGQVGQRADAFVVVSPEHYLGGPLGARTRLRNPAEAARLDLVAGLFPRWVLEVSGFPDGLALDLRAPLVASHPRADLVRSLFPAEAQLRSPTRVPSASPLYLAASLDWEAGARLRGHLASLGPLMPPPAPSSVAAPVPSDGPGSPRGPFDPRQGPVTPGDPSAALREGVGRIRELLGGALLDWAGPELALIATWDTRTPRAGVLIQGRDPKAAVGAIRRYRATEVGKKLRFVDGEAAGVPYRYTRLDGVDPRWLEPCYGFVGPSLCLATSRTLLERLLDEAAPKIEETPAFGGLFSRLGRDLRLAAYLTPSLLPRLQGLLLRASGRAPAPGSPEERAARVLGRFSEQVRGLALGAGLARGEELRAAMVLSLRSEGELR